MNVKPLVLSELTEQDKDRQVLWLPRNVKDPNDPAAEWGTIKRWHDRGVFVTFEHNVCLCEPDQLFFEDK